MKAYESLAINADHFDCVRGRANKDDGCHSLLRSAAGHMHHYREKQAIFYEGDPARYVYGIQSGTVKVYKLLSDGRRLITGFFFPGDIIGFAPNESYTGTAEAIKPTKIISVPRSYIESMINQDPIFGKRLLNAAFDELETTRNQMLLLGRKKTIEKVASFLLWAADKTCGRDGGDSLIVKLPMTRSEIADYLGLTVETVCRVMTRLKERKVISATNTREIVLLNKACLEDYAEGGETEYNQTQYAA